MPAPFNYPTKWYRRMVFRRTSAQGVSGLDDDVDDFIRVLDNSGTVIFSLRWDGKIEALKGIDIGSNFGFVEIAVLNNANGPFRIYNASDNAYPFISYSKSFNVPGTSYSNGTTNLVPMQFRGVKTTPGAPTGGSAGTWVTGDVIMDSNKVWWLCTAGGTPGTWV